MVDVINYHIKTDFGTPCIHHNISTKAISHLVSNGLFRRVQEIFYLKEGLHEVRDPPRFFLDLAGKKETCRGYHETVMLLERVEHIETMQIHTGRISRQTEIPTIHPSTKHRIHEERRITFLFYFFVFEL